MKKTVVLAIVAGLAVVAVPAMTSAGLVAAGHHLTATMSPSQVVTPTNKPATFPAPLRKARGAFSATTSADGRTLTWKLSYSHVGDPALVLADIHIGKPGKFGPILVRVCGPCKPGQSGKTKLKPGYAQQLVSGKDWLTLITDKYPNGLVRGQITAK